MFVSGQLLLNRGLILIDGKYITSNLLRVIEKKGKMNGRPMWIVESAFSRSLGLGSSMWKVPERELLIKTISVSEENLTVQFGQVRQFCNSVHRRGTKASIFVVLEPVITNSDIGCFTVHRKARKIRWSDGIEGQYADIYIVQNSYLCNRSGKPKRV